MVRFKVVWNVRGNLLKDGTAPVHLRVYNGKYKYIHLKILLTKKRWKNLDIPTNLYINKMVTKAQEFYMACLTNNEHFTVETLTNNLFNLSNESLNDFCKWYIDKRGVTESTLHTDKALIRMLDEYGIVNMENIDYTFLKSFQSFLKNRGLKKNSIALFMGKLRTYVKEANRMDKCVDPFKMIHLEKEKIPARPLSEGEIEALPNSKHLIRFKFLCYTGLRYSDSHVKYNNTGILDIIPLKTIKYNTRVVLPLKKLFDGRPYDILKSVGEFKKYSLPAFSIAIKRESKQRLTSKQGRQSFASNMANRGNNQLLISKLLGHSSTQTTSIYQGLTTDAWDNLK